MKRLLFIILLFGVCLTFNRAHAQRCLPGMRGIQLTGGLSDNMRWKNGDGFGYHAGIAVSTYTKNAHHWVVGAEYLEKRYGYRDCLYPASQLTGEGGYYLNFLSDRKKTFFAALGLSALAGYETVNWGESLLPDGSRLTDEDNFIYGGCADAGAVRLRDGQDCLAGKRSPTGAVRRRLREVPHAGRRGNTFYDSITAIL